LLRHHLKLNKLQICRLSGSPVNDLKQADNIGRKLSLSRNVKMNPSASMPDLREILKNGKDIAEQMKNHNNEHGNSSSLLKKYSTLKLNSSGKQDLHTKPEIK
jgi:hypothetical protein